ncbi:hypothetical protein OAJ35_02810 [Gammaproteobacteria bacterium]|nr:hypothetical protein [Gammaproteobacteria bacterium]
MRDWSLEEAFRAFKAKKWDHYKTWSSIADNGISVVTLWNHQIESNLEERKYYYSCFDAGDWWHSDIGNQKRKEHLQNALDLHDGYFSAIRVYSRNKETIPLEIKRCSPMDKNWWKIINFDSETGEFSAECDTLLLRGKKELFPSFL